MISNNPAKPENFDVPAQSADDEVSLQDLGLFDDELPPAAAFHDHDHNPTSHYNPTSLNSAQSEANLVRRDLTDTEYVEVATLDDDDLEGKLACAICYQPYYPEQLTVVSKERINFEAAIVACPQCLAEMQTEVKRRTIGADLTLGAIWGVVATLVWVVIFAWLTWSQRSSTAHIWWWWFGCFLAFLPAWCIGKAVFIGVGRKSSLVQQFLSLFLTLFVIYTQFYVAQLAYYNFLDDIKAPEGHLLEWIGPLEATKQLLPSILGVGPLVDLAIVVGVLLGLATAWFVSEGPRLYTRPFVEPEKVKKSWLAKTRQFLNV